MMDPKDISEFLISAEQELEDKRNAEFISVVLAFLTEIAVIRQALTELGAKLPPSKLGAIEKLLVELGKW